jgi:hypothetical protein
MLASNEQHCDTEAQRASDDEGHIHRLLMLIAMFIG